jgi:transcription elongation factor Elf1
MLKFLKETPVYVTCPHCGKAERTRLKWAKHHKAMKCKHCKKNIDLRDKGAQRIIGQTAAAMSMFQQALDSLHSAAKKAGKALRGKKSKSKKKMKSKGAKKKPAKRRSAAKKPAAPKPTMTSIAPTPQKQAPAE